MDTKILLALFSISVTIGLINCVCPQSTPLTEPVTETTPSPTTPEPTTTTTPEPTTTTRPAWIDEFRKSYHPCNRTLKGWFLKQNGLKERCRFGFSNNTCSDSRGNGCENEATNTVCCQNNYGCNRCTSKFYFNFFSYNFFNIIFYSTFFEPCPHIDKTDVPTDCSPKDIQVIEKPTGCVYLQCPIFNKLSTIERSIASTDIGEVGTEPTTQTPTLPHFTGLFYTDSE
jgi:hypothetical protein